MLSGDADFFSNRRSNGDDMLLFAFSWLDNNRFQFRCAPQSLDLNISVSSGVASMQIWIFLYILHSAIVLLIGIVLLVRRKLQIICKRSYKQTTKR